MLVRKAIITAAARTQRDLPLQTLIDGEGKKKSLLSILIEQSLAAGAEEIAIVVWPGDESSYAQAAGAHASSVRFIPQNLSDTATPCTAHTPLRTAIPFCTWWATTFM